jgi:hypothetical protein
MVTIKQAGIAGAIASVAALVGTVLPAQAAATPAWQQVESHHFGPAAGYSGYETEAAFARNNIWAFGGSDLGGGTGTLGFPVAVHFNGSTWTAATLPAGLTSDIIAVSAPAANDIWAVTHYGGWILHYDGSAWHVAKHLSSSSGGFDLQFTGITAFSTRNVWAFGGGGEGPGMGTWHFDGSTWRHETTTALGAGIVSATAVSASNMWGAGSVSSPGDTLEHFNGTSWSVVRNSALTGLGFVGLKAFSATNIWAVAVKESSTSATYRLLHYSGHWSSVSLPMGLSASSDVSSDGHGGLWLTVVATSASTPQFYELHWAPGNVWQKYAIHGYIGGSSPELIPGTTSAVVGGFLLGKTTGASATLWAYGSI